MSTTAPRGKADLAARAEANFVGAWEAMAGALPAGWTGGNGGGVTVAATGITLAPFNLVFVTAAQADPTASLRRAVADVTGRGLAALVRVRTDLRAEVAAAEAMATDDVGELPAMMMAPVRSLAPLPPRLVVHTVTDEAGAADHLRVVAAAFGLPEQPTAPLVSRPVWSMAGFEMYVAYADDVAVATAALCMTGATAGVYNVAVDSALRNRGLGQALTAHAVRRGVERYGADEATLQASDAGLRVYTRMGFETVSHYRGFVVR